MRLFRVSLLLEIALLSCSRPAIYRIRVQGEIDESLADRLGGMAMTTTCSVDKVLVTILEGQVADQAALSGLLNTLYGLHMPLISVEYLDKKDKGKKIK